MFRVQRSPSSSKTNPPTETLSDSDIPSTQKEIVSTPYITTRQHKRARVDGSPKHFLDDFRKEIMDMLHSWKAEHDSFLSKLAQDINDLKSQCKNIQKSNLEIERSMDFINKSYEAIKNRVESLETENKENKNYLLTLDKKLNELQYSTRSANIEIRNVPQKENENVQDLTTIVTKIGNLLETPLQSGDLRDIYRAPAKPGTTRNIVVEFSSVQRKYDVLSSVRNYNKARDLGEKLNTHLIGLPGNKQPFYVDEHLPPSGKKLFFQAREFSKQNGFKFCWVNNSKIYLRKEKGTKQFIINSEQSLLDIKNNQ